MNQHQLLFVYNADSGLFNSLTEFAHKIISPSTYQCQLCALTYGKLSIKQEWKLFIDSLSVKSIFLYKDKFHEIYNIDATFPAIFIKDNESIKVFLSKEEIIQCVNLCHLQELITSKLAKYDQRHHSHI